MKSAEYREWSGTAADLQCQLGLFASGNGIDTRANGWPKQPHVLSRRINEAIPNLRRLGLNVTHGWQGSQRIVRLVRSDGGQNGVGSEGSEGLDGNEST